MTRPITFRGTTDDHRRKLKLLIGGASLFAAVCILAYALGSDLPAPVAIAIAAPFFLTGAVILTAGVQLTFHPDQRLLERTRLILGLRFREEVELDASSHLSLNECLNPSGAHNVRALPSFQVWLQRENAPITLHTSGSAEHGMRPSPSSP